jgi:hypothetical protein
MKTAWNCLVLALVAATGCVELPRLWDNPKAKSAAPAKAAPAGPLSADQVNEANAHEKADVLRQELDRDGQPASKGLR